MNTIIRLILPLLLIAVVPASQAFEIPPLMNRISNDPFCNARKVPGGAQEIAQRTPDYSNLCYLFAREIIRKATGHNYNLDNAEGIVETLLILDPKSAYPRISSVELELKKHGLKLKAKSIYEIYRDAQAATKIKPPIADAYITLGRVSLLQGCLVCAERAAERAAEIDNQNPILALLLASIAEERNDLVEARAILTNAVVANSELLTATIKLEMQLRISFLHALDRNYAEADKSYQKAIEIDPKSPIPYLARAQLLLLIGDADNARKAARKSNKMGASVAAKRLQSYAEYLIWAKAYLAGEHSTDLKKLLRTAFVSPEEAFVESARYEATSSVTEALLQTEVIRDIDTRDEQGNTALMTACLGNNTQLANLLITRNSNLNAQNSKGERALSHLVSNGNHKLALALLRANAEVNFVDVNGISPLAIAVFRNDMFLVKELIAHNAAIQPVVELAKRLGIPKIEEVINSMLPASA